MVDSLENCEPTRATTRLQVRPDNIFVHQGFLAEPGLVEHIAQTAAAHAGYWSLQQGATDAPVGYIAAVDHLQITTLPPLGAVLETTVEIRNQVLQVTIIAGTTRCNGELVAQCEMKIFTRS